MFQDRKNLASSAGDNLKKNVLTGGLKN